MVLVEVPLEVIDGQLVTTLEATIVFTVHLNSIVGQMDVSRVQVRQVKLL